MKQKRKLTDFTPDRYAEFQKMYVGESDRVVGILAATFLETSLEEFILARLVDDATTKELFGRMAPLSTFSGKIKIAFAMGMLPKSTYKDVEVVREIRNRFAHSPNPLNFESPEIQHEFSKSYTATEGVLMEDGSHLPLSDLVSALGKRKDGSRTNLTNARLSYLWVVSNATMEMQRARNEMERLKVPGKYWRIAGLRVKRSDG